MLRVYFSSEILVSNNDYIDVLENLKTILKTEKVKLIETELICDKCNGFVAIKRNDNQFWGVYHKYVNGEVICNECLKKMEV